MGFNRLHDQRSPYLLQNAQSPVHWYPWGQEAIDEAQKKDKPIFLSIGFSASHWCCVMDVKYFKEKQIKILNEKFVCIKVDRQERPDIAKVYMSYLEDVSIYWPLSFFLYPDLKPFESLIFYHEDCFAEVLSDLNLNLVRFLRDCKGKCNGTTVADFLRLFTNDLSSSLTLPATSRSLHYNLCAKDVLYLCSNELASNYNERLGGLVFGSRFCRPVEIQLMLYQSKELREAKRSSEANKVLEMVYFTLQCMGRWGIHDHIGGGFHQIGTCYRKLAGSILWTRKLDWPASHFEKMLYDQGQVANVYLDAFSLTNDPFYSRVSRDILDFLSRDMKGEFGEFYSAVGAESGDATTKKEGAFYVWTRTEVDEILEGNATLFKKHYNIQPSGNCLRFKRCHAKDLIRKNVLIETTAGMVKSKFEGQYRLTLEECKKKLFTKRYERPTPDLDKMVIVSWNGLVISSLARASKILKGESEGTSGCDPREYFKVAEEAASFIQKNLYKDGRLHHTYFENFPSEVHGFLDDYAFLISGLLDLYEFGGEIKWLNWASKLQEVQDELFLDRVEGGYYYTEDKGLAILHVKDYCDDSEPSGNSVSAINLQRLASMVAGLKSDRYRQNAKHLLAFFEGVLEENPMKAPLMCCAADMFSLPYRQRVVLIRHNSCVGYDDMLVAAHASYNPNRTVIHIDTSNTQDMEFWEAENNYLANLAKETKGEFSHVIALVWLDVMWSRPITNPRLLKALLCWEKKAGAVQKKRKGGPEPTLTLPPTNAIFVNIETAEKIQNKHLEGICRATHAKVEIVNDKEYPYERKIVLKGTTDEIQVARAQVCKLIDKLEEIKWERIPCQCCLPRF